MSERFDTDVASESEEGSRTVEERFASRVTMNVPIATIPVFTGSWTWSTRTTTYTHFG